MYSSSLNGLVDVRAPQKGVAANNLEFLEHVKRGRSNIQHDAIEGGHREGGSEQIRAGDERSRSGRDRRKSLDPST